jgi:hypothetical protein
MSEPARGGRFGVDPPGGACWNELDGHRPRLDYVLVPQQVNMVSARIHEAHAHGVHMRRAGWIVSFIGGHRSCGDDDEAVTGVGVPTAALPR